MARRRRASPALDTELAALSPEQRWREWMARVEAVLFAASGIVDREMLARVVGRACSLELLMADLRTALRDRPYEVVAVAGGWQMSSIVTLQTGFAATVANGLDTSNTGAFFDRPNATGQEVDLPRGQQDPQRFFNTGAFAVQAAGTHGNVGRNTLTTPGIIGWDFSLLKNFNLKSETRYLQFRFEAFNFPNHPNWGNPDTNVSSGNFGRITGTRSNMRQLQFGLKLNF